ncbi:hypothetical protein ACQY0O_008430 [Thecaphora frezii]
MAKSKSADPVQAARKAAQAKQAKRNREQRAKVREAVLLRKDTTPLENDIRALERRHNRSDQDEQQLRALRDEVERIHKVKQHYVAKHPEHRRLVVGYERSPEEIAQQEAQKAAQQAANAPPGMRMGLGGVAGRDPRWSVYYDPVFNPYGAPPPGMPYAEKPYQQLVAEGLIQPRELSSKLEPIGASVGSHRLTLSPLRRCCPSSSPLLAVFPTSAPTVSPANADGAGIATIPAEDSLAVAGDNQIGDQDASGDNDDDDDDDEEDDDDDNDDDDEEDEDDGIVMPEGPPPLPPGPPPGVVAEPSGADSEEDEDDDDDDDNDIVMPEGPPPLPAGPPPPPLPSQSPIPTGPKNSSLPARPPPLPPYGQPPPPLGPPPLLPGGPPMMHGQPYPPPPPPGGYTGLPPPLPPPRHGWGRGRGGPPPYPSGGGFRGGRPPQHRGAPQQTMDPITGEESVTYQGQRFARPPLPPRPPLSGSFTAPPSGPSGTAGPSRPRPPPPSAPPRPPPSVVLSAAPQLRDLKKEATAFVPAAIRKKQQAEKQRIKMGLPGRIEAAPGGSGGGGAADGAEGNTAAEQKPDLLLALQPHLDAGAARKGKARDEESEYSRFLDEVGDLL